MSELANHEEHHSNYDCVCVCVCRFCVVQVLTTLSQAISVIYLIYDVSTQGVAGPGTLVLVTYFTKTFTKTSIALHT